jgi:hypothetical protein
LALLTSNSPLAGFTGGERHLPPEEGRLPFLIRAYTRVAFLGRRPWGDGDATGLCSISGATAMPLVCVARSGTHPLCFDLGSIACSFGKTASTTPTSGVQQPEFETRLSPPSAFSRCAGLTRTPGARAGLGPRLTPAMGPSLSRRKFRVNGFNAHEGAAAGR